MDKFPNWLRWLLFFPASIVATIIVYPLFLLVNYLFDPGYGSIFSKIYSIIIGTGFTGYIFVWVAVKVVPKHQFVISIIMTAVYGLMAGVALFSKLVLGDAADSSWLEVLASVVVGTIGAIIACYRAHEDSLVYSRVSRPLLNSEIIDDLENKLYTRNETDKEIQIYKQIEDCIIDKLSVLINYSDSNQLTKYVKEFYDKIGRGNDAALTMVRIFYIWCIRTSISALVRHPTMQEKILDRFDSKVFDFCLEWTDRNKLDQEGLIAKMFNIFADLDEVILDDEIGLMELRQSNINAVNLGRIVLSKIHENLGDAKIDVDRITMMLPKGVFDEVRHNVLRILHEARISHKFDA